MEFRKMVTITLYTRQQKRHWCIEQSFGLCGRGRGWEDLGEWHWNMYNTIYETSLQSRFDARYWMLGAGALGRPRGIVWGSLFKTEITGLVARRSNWVETEMEMRACIFLQQPRLLDSDLGGPWKHPSREALVYTHLWGRTESSIRLDGCNRMPGPHQADGGSLILSSCSDHTIGWWHHSGLFLQQL